MLRLTARYRDDTVRFPVSAGEALLGAGSENDFVLPFPGVSRHHARISLKEGDVVIRDTSSQNGLHIDGRRVEEVRLKRGDSAQIGHTVLILDEAPTSEFEVGLELAPDPGRPLEDRRSTGVGLGSGHNPPAAGIRLIREMEGRGGEGFPSRLQEILAHLRTVLGADAVVLAEFVKGDVSILGGVGQLPANQSFSGLNTVEPPESGLASVPPDPEGGTRAAVGWMQEGSPRTLAVFFGTLSLPVPP
jgi:pSer/pThr/pTyr-binding forkhead associated (FHA) protein